MITISKLRRRLKLDVGDDEDLADVKALIIQLFEQETKRLWDRRVGFIEQFQPMTLRETNLYLRLSPVETLTLVEEKNESDTTWTSLATTDYVLHQPAVPTPPRLQKLTGYWFPMVRVTYTGGYTPEPTGIQVKTPFDIQEAFFIQALFQRTRFGAEKVITRSQNFEGGQGVFEEGTLHPYFKRVVAQYVRKV